MCALNASTTMRPVVCATRPLPSRVVARVPTRQPGIQFHMSRTRIGKPSSRVMLLPLPNRYVQETSLAAHLALAVCRSGQGGTHQLYQLIRTTYHSYLLWRDGCGESTHEMYSDAEKALESTAETAYRSDQWRLGEDASVVVQRMVSVFDAQLNIVSRGSYLHSKAKLEDLLRLEIPSKLSQNGAGSSTPAHHQ